MIKFLIQLWKDAFAKPYIPTPEVIKTMTPQPAPPKYLWDNPVDCRHSLRVICDEEGLDLEQKNTMCATVGGESGWITTVKNYNYAFHPDGTKYLASTDFGICQWNDFYHGKEISPEDAVNNPEKAVRLMCAYWKRGQRNLWCAYNNGRYKLFLNVFSERSAL